MHDANNATLHNGYEQLAAYGTTGTRSYDWVDPFSLTPQGRSANERGTFADLPPKDPAHDDPAPPPTRTALEETEQRLEAERAYPKIPKPATDDPVWNNEKDPFADSD